jgi:hypothetical protein
MFIGLGGLLIILAVTGNARTAPGLQKTFGRWLTSVATHITNTVPAGLGWVIVAALAGGVAYLSMRSLRRPPRNPDSPNTADAAASPAATCCEHHRSEPPGPDLEGATR